MSNALSVAATTAALAWRLTQAMAEFGMGGDASAGRPDGADPEKPAIKVFLYRVDLSAARRNDDLPTRSGEAVVTRPRAALILHYLLCFLGDEDTAVPEKLLGIAATNVHAQPLLTRKEIEKGWAKVGPVGANGQDLSAAPDRVRLSIVGLALEEISHVWSSLMGQPYRLSLAVTADVVVLEPKVVPIRPLPVTSRGLYSSAVLSPEVSSVSVAGTAPGAPVPIVAGEQLELRGRDLMSEDTTVVLVGHLELSPDGSSSSKPAPPPTSDRLFVTLPVATPPGVLGIAVEHRRSLGVPPSPRTVRQSPLYPIVVAPAMTSAKVVGTPTPAGGDPRTYSGTTEITVQQAVPDDQAVTMLLSGGREAFAFEQATRGAASPSSSRKTFSIPFTGVPAGDYLVRVVIAGVQSTPSVVDSGPLGGTIAGPKVTIS
ncbi:hypothetical protein GCM10022219_09670 [Microbacterium oryzae]|uniref:DUF4255 domain-containing protein n=1 Tax=Microbacterium oryzae TaxID=743009 RepID=A0A6I6E2Q1_9MICO|nr:DUF4255 domain-containing protein [Microbacterium oryzae]QGU27027.1 DUF4255 domain-containing protein [Microbacterium oryzae]